MANLIGGIGPYPGLDNDIFGTNDPDIIFGDPFTTGNTFGVLEIGGALSSGQGGSDRLFGRGGDDTIFGDAWAITDLGRGGDDRLDGGNGIDTLYGDAFSIDSFGAEGGNDRLDGGRGNDILYGDAFEMASGRGGNDRLDGGAGDDTLSGDAHATEDFFFGGDDRLEGGNGKDTLYGDSVTTLFLSSGFGGDDQLYGGSDDDILYGDFIGERGASGGNDLLDGGTGDDVLYGDVESAVDTDGGTDTLIGGRGNDQLWGDGVLGSSFPGPFPDLTGADQFLFARYSGRDQIFDFGIDKDVIQISGYGYTSFADLLPNISDDANGNAVLHLNGTVDQVTLLGVQTDELSADNFIFSNAGFALV
ncbi:calcium-binding protein [Sinorhizobium terangae]|uniref:Calcium-binding protein n=1 Tax=Sinorhizobium terangae TaxID=110322 RepID=A0A6N7L7C6_SINTE|nr:calcium-binding protein [Sinorhizobium terangae]MBB4185727.1 Ca2+-binding RTX toxin-like protein [Sinorhizobium terangae]MQX13190.1 calcium-binding protein [Sinorhizobium terangae]WFU46218.1 calcium-binding protein [Sinorhizobium terangae]